jgi:hypothetical protein
MIEVVRETVGLTLEELEAQTAEMLPAREEMSLINIQAADVVDANVQVGAQVLTDDSTLNQGDQQIDNAPIEQTVLG